MRSEHAVAAGAEQVTDHAVVGALHALDGLLILGIAAYLYFWSRRRES